MEQLYLDVYHFKSPVSVYEALEAFDGIGNKGPGDFLSSNTRRLQTWELPLEEEIIITPDMLVEEHIIYTANPDGHNNPPGVVIRQDPLRDNAKAWIEQGFPEIPYALLSATLVGQLYASLEGPGDRPQAYGIAVLRDSRRPPWHERMREPVPAPDQIIVPVVTPTPVSTK